MSDEIHYETCMDVLAGAIQTLRLLPLDKILNTISRAEALGPILYPSEFRTANLTDQRRLVEAVQRLVKVAEQIEAEARR